MSGRNMAPIWVVAILLAIVTVPVPFVPVEQVRWPLALLVALAYVALLLAARDRMVLRNSLEAKDGMEQRLLRELSCRASLISGHDAFDEFMTRMVMLTANSQRELILILAIPAYPLITDLLRPEHKQWYEDYRKALELQLQKVESGSQEMRVQITCFGPAAHYDHKACLETYSEVLALNYSEETGRILERLRVCQERATAIGGRAFGFHVAQFSNLRLVISDGEIALVGIIPTFDPQKGIDQQRDVRLRGFEVTNPDVVREWRELWQEYYTNEQHIEGDFIERYKSREASVAKRSA